MSNEETKEFAQSLPTLLQNELKNVNSFKRYTILAPDKQAWDNIKKNYNREKLEQVFLNIYK